MNIFNLYIFKLKINFFYIFTKTLRKNKLVQFREIINVICFNLNYQLTIPIYWIKHEYCIGEHIFRRCHYFLMNNKHYIWEGKPNTLWREVFKSLHAWIYIIFLAMTFSNRLSNGSPFQGEIRLAFNHK